MPCRKMAPFVNRLYSVDGLTPALSQLMRGVFLEWAANVISTERLAKEAVYGFALALLACATDETVPLLKARIRDLQTALARSRRALVRCAAVVAE